jgi:hypothetical protein
MGSTVQMSEPVAMKFIVYITTNSVVITRHKVALVFCAVYTEPWDISKLLCHIILCVYVCVVCVWVCVCVYVCARVWLYEHLCEHACVYVYMCVLV